MNFDYKSDVKIINDNSIDAFHDRELILEGLTYLENKLSNHKNVEYNFIRDL